MFLLWGHSFEFARDDSWDKFEEFSEIVSGKKDIWYATNIEIYDYVKAYENLRVSFDKKIIHNPNSIDVWLYDEGETLVVKSGETIYR